MGMAKSLEHSISRVKDLLAFSLGMMNGENGRLLMERYKDAIESITPFDMLALEDKQLEMGITPGLIKKDIEKVVNVFFKSLANYHWDKPVEENFLYYLMLENKAFTFRLNQVKKIIKSYKDREQADFAEMKMELLPHFKEFITFDAHYVKKENILFPYLEKLWKQYRPLKVMWSLHDDIRNQLKIIISILESQQSSWNNFNKILGKYYFLVFGMIQKEDLIVYPVAAETVSKDQWYDMHIQSFEYRFPFIEKPTKPTDTQPKKRTLNLPRNPKLGIQSETGNMTAEQALLIFNNLPVDLTLVDENDKVVFFNKAKDRFFPRSPAIIGRAVQNCHPPESLDTVEKIIAEFRSGTKQNASFWIQMQGRFIVIQYYALRDESGGYKGVLEVSQDITELRSLKDEKRLLDWE
jgi:hypothetical protein